MTSFLASNPAYELDQGQTRPCPSRKRRSILHFGSLIAFGILPLVAIAPLTAQAREMCGLTTFLDEWKAGTREKNFSAMCIALQGCSMFSDLVLGHRLQMARQEHEKSWRILLDVPQDVDISEGVTITVDDGEPMRVPPEFLEESPDGRAIILRPEVRSVVIDVLRKGRLVNWRYVRKDGKVIDVAIPIRPLRKVMDWASCTLQMLDAQARAMQQTGK